jgi:hypothetical protein
MDKLRLCKNRLKIVKSFRKVIREESCYENSIQEEGGLLCLGLGHALIIRSINQRKDPYD